MRLQPMFQFGDFQFDPEALLLTRGSRSLDLSPKALQVLAVLVRNAGRIVSKDDLLSIVWPNAVVEEGNLSVHIFALRRALGTRANEYIETVPKRGYRFVATLASKDSCRIAEYYIQQQTPDGCRQAAVEYRKCTSAKAKAGLANTLLFRMVLGDLSKSEAVPPAKRLLEEAHQIDPACADVHVSRSRLLCLGEWQWDKAEDSLRHACELAQDDETRSVVAAWQGYSLVERGDIENGLERLHWAHATYPLSPFISRFLADAHFMARDFYGCVAMSRKALQLHPHSWLLYRTLGRALTALGEYGEARREYRRATRLCNSPHVGLLADFAYLEAAAGNKDRAAALLSRLSRRHAPLVPIAQIHSALGNKDRAVYCLEQACSNRDWSLSALKQDYRFDPLRADPRYRTVLAHVGI